MAFIVPSGQYVRFTVEKGESVLLRSASGSRARLELDTGSKIVTANHTGVQVYGPFPAGSMTAGSITGELRVTVGANPVDGDSGPLVLTKAQSSALLASNYVAPGLAGGYSIFSGNGASDSAATIQNQIPALQPFSGVRLVYNNQTASDLTLSTAKIASPTTSGGNGSTLTWTPVTFSGATSVTLPAAVSSGLTQILTPVVSDYMEIVPANSLNLLMTRTYYAGVVGATSAGTGNVASWRTISGMSYFSDRAAGVIADNAAVSGSSTTICPDGVIFYYRVPTTVVSCFGGSHLRGNQTTSDAWGFMYRACAAKTTADRIYTPFMNARGGSGQAASIGNLEKVLTAGMRIDVALILSYSGNDLDASETGFAIARGYLGKALELCKRYSVRPIVCTAPPIQSYAADERARLVANNDFALSLRNHGIDVLDLNRLYRDPSDNGILYSTFNSGDNIHCNDTGQAVSTAALMDMLP